MGGFTFGLWAQLGTTQAVAASGNYLFGTVDNAGKVSAEISVVATFDASATASEARVQIERDIDGTNFESIDAAPWSVPLPFTAASTQTERTISVPADLVGKFRVRVVNDDITYGLTGVAVNVRQSTYA
jgi:hypothetical protein